MSPHLQSIKDARFRTAMTKLRASSHTLEIEKGRHYGHSREDRLCHVCKVVEDEHHFVLDCLINTTHRVVLFDKLSQFHINFRTLNDSDKLSFLFMSRDPTILTWFGKFIYRSFRTRKELFDTMAKPNTNTTN